MSLDKTCHMIAVYISVACKQKVIDGNVAIVTSFFYISCFNLLTPLKHIKSLYPSQNIYVMLYKSIEGEANVSKKYGYWMNHKNRSLYNMSLCHYIVLEHICTVLYESFVSRCGL